MPTLYTPGDAALELRVSTQTIRRWAVRGELPVAARTPNGTYLFGVEDVRRAVARRREAGAAQARPAPPHAQTVA